MSQLDQLLTQHQTEMDNFTTGEKGDLAYKSTLSACVDFYGCMGSLVTPDTTTDFMAYFIKAYQEDAVLAVKLLLKCRDIRQGLGVRNNVRQALCWLETRMDVAKLAPLFVRYGRWDDLFIFTHKETMQAIAGECAACITFSGDQYKSLLQQYIQENTTASLYKETASLLAKWLPRKPKCNNQRYLLNQICNRLNWTRKQLRHWCTGYPTLEQQMSAKQWHEIDYNKVPSQANVKWNHLFKRHDETRYTQWVNDLSEGKAGTKVNASTLYPHQIVAGFINDRVDLGDDARLLAEQLWGNLPNFLEGVKLNVIPMVDCSGSMYNNQKSIHKAVALGVYLSQRVEGVFKNKLITFSERPAYVNIGLYSSLGEKVKAVLDCDALNTNFRAALDLIYDTIVENELPQSEVPEALVVLSDMNWDRAEGIFSGKPKTVFQEVYAKYEQAGYIAPKVIFWNLYHNGSFQCTINDNGVVQLSGFSPSVFTDVLPVLTQLTPSLVVRQAVKAYDNDIDTLLVKHPDLFNPPEKLTPICLSNK